jgi:methylthioribose-1-phosphate isomerase
MYTVAKSSDSVNAHDLTIQYHMRREGTAAAFGLQHNLQNKQELEIKHSNNIFCQNEIESWSSYLNLSRPTAFNQVYTEKRARGYSTNSHVNEIKEINSTP